MSVSTIGGARSFVANAPLVKEMGVRTPCSPEHVVQEMMHLSWRCR